MDAAYAVSGLVVGFIVGLTGVGAGALMTPLLVLVFGVPPSVAVGTDLLYASITKGAGSWVHASRGNVDWGVVGRLAAGSVPAAFLTLLLLKSLNVDDRQFSEFITVALGVALVLTACSLVFKRRAPAVSAGERESMLPARWQAAATVVVGALLGVLVTLTSVGAGALGMAALIALYPRLPAVTLVGIDIAHAVPLTLVAGLGHAALGTVDFGMLASLLVGSLPGIYLGSHAAHRAPQNLLRYLLAAMLLVVGGKLVI